MNPTPSATVYALWIGGEMPVLEQLSIHCYLHQGVDLHLFTYHHDGNIPEGTTLRDAREIIPEEYIFQDSSGRYELFTDWFRYTFLHMYGGVWTQLDMLCLSPDLPNADQPWLAQLPFGEIGRGILSFPAGHSVMQHLSALYEDPAYEAPWDDALTRLSKSHLREQYPDVRQRRVQAPWGDTEPQHLALALDYEQLSDAAAPASSIYPLERALWRHSFDGTLHLDSTQLAGSWAVCLWAERYEREPYALLDIHPESLVGTLLRRHMPKCLESKIDYTRPLYSSIQSDSDTNILIAVCSCLKAKARRDGVRATWMSEPVAGIQSVFYVGDGETLVDEPHCVQLAANDLYDYLPEKTLAFFQYALANLHFEWLFKCDDDTYVDLSRLPELCQMGCDYVGNPWLETRGSPSGGAGYLLSRALVERLVAQRARLSHRGAEDVLIGELALELCEQSHASPRLNYGKHPFPLVFNDLITAHWLSPEQMERIHRLRKLPPSFRLWGAHPHWQDQLYFYPCGFFIRETTGCMGSWEITCNDQLVLHWDGWEAETLSACKQGYQSGEFCLYHPTALATLSISPTWWSNYKQQIELHQGEACETALICGRKLYNTNRSELLADIFYHSHDSIMLKRSNRIPEFYTRDSDNSHRYRLWKAPSPAQRQKVGILYICTGCYDIFWESFYQAAKKNLFLNHDVHYYVFTDSANVQGGDDVTIIKKPFLRWPYELLHRYHTFVEYHAHFANCDYLYFFNANCLPKNPINEEVFPDEHQGLVATLHFGFCFSAPEHYTYERNPLSRAYIPIGRGYAYLAGGFNGGRTRDFMRMAHIIKENVDADSEHGLIACWHDESHFNHYLLDQSPLIVAPHYLLPSDDQPYTEDVRTAFSAYLKNICRYKNNIIDLNYLKQLD